MTVNWKDLYKQLVNDLIGPSIKSKYNIVIIKNYKGYNIKRRKEISSCLKEINIIKLKKKENRFILRTDQEGMFYLKLKGII